jgi:hypothetical protein
VTVLHHKCPHLYLPCLQNRQVLIELRDGTTDPTLSEDARFAMMNVDVAAAEVVNMIAMNIMPRFVYSPILHETIAAEPLMTLFNID